MEVKVLMEHTEVMGVMTRIIITTMVMEDGEDMTRTTMEVDTGAMAVMALVSEF
jgi:hypothetical protein